MCTLHGPERLHQKVHELDLTCHRRVFWKSLGNDFTSTPGENNIHFHFFLDDEERYYEQWFERLISDTEAEHSTNYGKNGILLGHFFPRSGLTIVFQVVRKGGSLLACAVNALSLALLNAGLPLTSTIFAFHYAAFIEEDTSMASSPSDDSKEMKIYLVCNPDAQQERDSLFSVTLVTENTTLLPSEQEESKILCLDYISKFDNSAKLKSSKCIAGESYFINCLEKSKEYAPALLDHFRTLLS